MAEPSARLTSVMYSSRKAMTAPFTEIAQQLASAGRRFDRYGWVLGTSGNLSAVLSREPLRLAISRSGASKGELAPDDILEVDAQCAVLRGQGRASAEAPLHVEIARTRGAGAVLHTHSIWSTILSDRFARDGGIDVEHYEMLKGLEGVTTHEHRERIPILENDQDMSRLAGHVRQLLKTGPACHAFLLRRHGMYTWGNTLPEAVRHVEVVEFLLEAVGRTTERSSHGRGQDSR